MRCTSDEIHLSACVQQNPSRELTMLIKESFKVHVKTTHFFFLQSALLKKIFKMNILFPKKCNSKNKNIIKKNGFSKAKFSQGTAEPSSKTTALWMVHVKQFFFFSLSIKYKKKCLFLIDRT